MALGARRARKALGLTQVRNPAHTSRHGANAGVPKTHASLREERSPTRQSIARLAAPALIPRSAAKQRVWRELFVLGPCTRSGARSRFQACRANLFPHPEERCEAARLEGRGRPERTRKPSQFETPLTRLLTMRAFVLQAALRSPRRVPRLAVTRHILNDVSMPCRALNPHSSL